MNQDFFSFEQFEEAVKDYFCKCSEEGARIDIRTVLKNNGVRLRGLTIFEGGEKITPTIYLEKYYEACMQGDSLEDVLESMRAAYLKRKRLEMVELQYFYEYESVKDTLRIKLINYEKNEAFLKEVPYIRFLDLAVICYSRIASGVLEDGTITVCQKHLDMWQITKEQLFVDAVIRSRHYAPEIMLEMEHFFRDMQEELPEEMQVDLSEEDCKRMCILTNCHKMNGASVIFYPEVLEQCAQYFQSDYYVLPSSVHEVIVMPECEEEVDTLLSMVKEVNVEQVAEEEVLSYHVYQYHRLEGNLEDIVTGDRVQVNSVE